MRTISDTGCFGSDRWRVSSKIFRSYRSAESLAELLAVIGEDLPIGRVSQRMLPTCLRYGRPRPQIELLVALREIDCGRPARPQNHHVPMPCSHQSTRLHLPTSMGTCLQSKKFIERCESRIRVLAGGRDRFGRLRGTGVNDFRKGGYCSSWPISSRDSAVRTRSRKVSGSSSTT